MGWRRTLGWWPLGRGRGFAYGGWGGGRRFYRGYGYGVPYYGYGYGYGGCFWYYGRWVCPGYGWYGGYSVSRSRLSRSRMQSSGERGCEF